MIFPCVKHANTKIQIQKYTNTAYDEVSERPNIFLKRGLFKDIKNDISMCQTCKYKIQIQNTQIQHITKCQKHPTYGIFLKRGLFKDITNDIPICQTGKYKNASTQIHKYRAYNKMTEKNMWHIFETVVQ